MSQAKNKHVDDLATLAWKVDISDKMIDVRVNKKTLWATIVVLTSEVSIEKQDWRTSIVQKLTQPSSSMVARELKDFTLINGQLCSEAIMEF